MVWCEQATNHYLGLVCWRIYASLSLNELMPLWETNDVIITYTSRRFEVTVCYCSVDRVCLKCDVIDAPKISATNHQISIAFVVQMTRPISVESNLNLGTLSTNCMREHRSWLGPSWLMVMAPVTPIEYHTLTKRWCWTHWRPNRMTTIFKNATFLIALTLHLSFKQHNSFFKIVTLVYNFVCCEYRCIYIYIYMKLV